MVNVSSFSSFLGPWTSGLMSYTSLEKFPAISSSNISSYVSVVDFWSRVHWTYHFMWLSLLLFPCGLAPGNPVSPSPAICHLLLNSLHRFLWYCIVSVGLGFIGRTAMVFFFFFKSFRSNPHHSQIASALSLRPSGVFII